MEMRVVICCDCFIASRIFVAHLQKPRPAHLTSFDPSPLLRLFLCLEGTIKLLPQSGKIVFKVVQIKRDIIKKMLSEGLLAHSAHNRRCEKTMVQLSSILRKMQKQDYQDLIQWGFLTANQLQLLPSTKFLARAYFDSAITCSDEGLDALPLFLAALCLAIKVALFVRQFNELRSVSQRLSPEVMFRSAGICYSGDNYFCLEMRVLGALRFKLSYTTPYDYLDIFMARFPFFPKMDQALPIFIEFANVHAASCEHTSQELFFGAVLATISLSKLTLSSFQSRILLTLTDSWPRSKTIKHLILTAMQAASPPSASP